MTIQRLLLPTHQGQPLVLININLIQSQAHFLIFHASLLPLVVLYKQQHCKLQNQISQTQSIHLWLNLSKNLFPTILLRILFKSRTVSRLPPSPLALPIIGHLHLLDKKTHQALYKLSNRYGPLYQLVIGPARIVVASSPEMAKEFLKTHEITFSNRPMTSIIDYITYGSRGFTFTPYGPYWKFVKKLFMSELLGGPTLDLLYPVRRDEIVRLMKLLSRKARAGEVVNINAELGRMTNNIISRMTMSKRCSEKEDEAGNVRKIIREMIELSRKFSVSDIIPFCKNLDLQGFKKRTKDVVKKYDVLIEKIIEEHEANRRKYKKNKEAGSEKVKDLLDILLDISEDEESTDIRLTRDDIKALILEMFGAGTDSSATTVEWAMSELMNHPNIMQKAVQEIDSIIGQSRHVEESDITNLPYLQAVVKETLRIHPPAPIVARQATEDCEIGGYHIPAKTRLFVNVWALGRDPNSWEDPLEFRPERFHFDEGSGNRSSLDVRGQHFQFLPFGSGRRGCPGTTLALKVVQTSLAGMLQCFEWKVNGEGNGKVDMEEGQGVTLPRAHPLVCFPMARLNPLPLLE